MSASKSLRTLALPLLLSPLLLVGCASGPSEDDVRTAWRACVDGFNARPEVVDQAWDDEYEATWDIGDLWWEFGSGDICNSLEDDVDPATWVEHTTDPDWYVQEYLAQ